MKNTNNLSIRYGLACMLLIAFIITMIIVLIISISNPVSAQVKDPREILLSKHLPSGITLKEQGPLSYSMITDYYNHDILGNFYSKMRIAGTYTRGLEKDQVKWDNVTIAQSVSKEADFPSGTKQEYMEGFTYVPSEKMMGTEPFSKFPVATGAFGKNLIWDVMGFEAFAWLYFDSLELNTPFVANKINGKINIEGLGSFENKKIMLTWTGISIMNDETCAVIEYLALDNPLDFKADFMDMKGRSHYWGTVWVSLSDKEIERAVLYEDVNMDMKLAGQEKSQLMNTTREIVFNKNTPGI
jgi:hypothetical protein